MHAAPAADRKKFLQGPGKNVKEQKNDKPEKKEEKEDKSGKPEKTNQATHSAFLVVDPIETIVGPIGRFMPDIESLPMHPSV